MSRRNTSVLLLPLLAAMALFYQGTPSTGAFHTAQVVGSDQKPAPAAAGKKNPEWERGRQAVRWFFNPPPGAKMPAAQTDEATIQFLIATVPDPVDSGLPHVYDRYMGSIQAAVHTQPYYLSRYDLPWEDCLAQSKAKEKDKDKDEKDSDADDASASSDQPDASCKDHRYRKEPGFLLLSNPSGNSQANPKKNADTSKIDLLLVYLVGETPSAGIQKRALYAALNEISWFCRWRESNTVSSLDETRSLARGCSKSGGEVRILGPSYSGSAQSLDLALSAWADSIPGAKPALHVKMISGIATAILNPPKIHDAPATDAVLAQGDFYNIRKSLQDRFTFQSMVIPDEVAESKLCSFLKAENPLKVRRLRVALLSESGTAYGNRDAELRDKGNEPKPQATDCDSAVEKTLLPYPAHISQLRAVSETLREAQRNANPEPQISSKNLPLSESLEDAGTRRDVKTFSPADAVTAEQVMSNLLAMIARERFDYVGIVATDQRDTMFLAQEVREHSPSSILFTYGGDLLYLHPEINQTLRGMLVVSSYPVNNAFQSWTLPPDFGLRLQFPDDGTEGVYNATLALLGDDKHMVEFSAPLVDQGKFEKVRPPVWISVVGRNRLWPVKTYEVSSDPVVDNYMYGLATDRDKSVSHRTTWRGLYSEGAMVFAGAFAALCIAFGLALLQPFRRRDAGPRTGFFAPVVSDRHRRAGELALVAGCASLGTFLIVLVTSLCIPAGAMLGLTGPQESLPWDAIAAIAAVGMAAAVLGAACIVLLRGSFQGPARGENPREWAPFAAGSAASVSLALALAASWIYLFGWRDRMAAVFASLRSLNMLSGVSALTPLFFISIAGMVWAVATFRRMRLLDELEGQRKDEKTVLEHLDLKRMQDELFDFLKCPSLSLGPGAYIVLALAAVAGLYLWFHLVHALESGWFYALLVISLFFVSLALWLGVLRFWQVWRHTHGMLERLALTPALVACKRFRQAFPTLPKIDLASSAATLAHLQCSVEQAKTLYMRAGRAFQAVQAKAIQEKKEGSGGTTVTMTAAPAGEAWLALSSQKMFDEIEIAKARLTTARACESAGWRTRLTGEAECRIALSQVAGKITNTLKDYWWSELHENEDETAESSSPEHDGIFRLGEEFLAGRLAHSLANVFQHMQNLICASLVGLMLLLFAISSYPFQPHNVLLVLNWIVILTVVGIALWVFVQMRRDPVLSYLNGTKPGEIGWDSEFVFRIFTYAVVPLLALLGAQFPQSVGQILSHLMSGGAHS